MPSMKYTLKGDDHALYMRVEDLLGPAGAPALAELTEELYLTDEHSDPRDIARTAAMYALVRDLLGPDGAEPLRDLAATVILVSILDDEEAHV